MSVQNSELIFKQCGQIVFYLLKRKKSNLLPVYKNDNKQYIKVTKQFVATTFEKWLPTDGNIYQDVLCNNMLHFFCEKPYFFSHSNLNLKILELPSSCLQRIKFMLHLVKHWK